ncbi:hypothetical protein [Mariniphaga sediminis]|uniref:hypothetical protein n=1 Tax=Mariniphaga sediminis TaxID=1628158 RepID=UPI00356639A3
MKKRICIIIVLSVIFLQLKAQQPGTADFRWGNGFYYNLNVGDSVTFNEVVVKLLGVENHFNRLKVGDDTVNVKVARRTVPEERRNIRIFAADNKNVKALASDSLIHGLSTKDALICLSDSRLPLLDPNQYIFPVSFNDGFLWGAEEDSYMFSFYQKDENQTSPAYSTYPGIGFNLHDARGLQKHWLVAIENSRVVWVEDKETDKNAACVLLESESQPGIYYVYNYLYNKTLAVKKGQKLFRGDPVGTAWGDKLWGHLQFCVVHADTEPDYDERFRNIINGFPQLFGLYFQDGKNVVQSFSRGKITFGQPRWRTGNKKNTEPFEIYSGKGWLTGKWNPADKVEHVTKGSEGNVRLKKILFEGTRAQCTNPQDFYDYQINVRNGTYRIRAKVGDLYLPSWQKIEFEGTTAATIALDAGETEWTGERVVAVEDGALTVRVYIDNENKKVAGLNEIVFQKAY